MLSWELLASPGRSWALLGAPGLSWILIGAPGFPGSSSATLGFAVVAAAAAALAAAAATVAVAAANKKQFLTVPDTFVLHLAKSSVATERKTRPSLPLQGEHIPLLNRANLFLKKILIFH